MSASVKLCVLDDINALFCLIKAGALSCISKILYLVSSKTAEFELIGFLRIKKVSISTLFLSEDGNANQAPPSSASYHDPLLSYNTH